MKAILIAAVFAASAASAAHATVVNFDSLTGQGVVPDGYGGITWSGNWNYYSEAQEPYNPASPPERIYRNYDTFGEGTASIPFYFSTPVVFDGAAIAGVETNPVTFDLYLGGTEVFSSAAFIPTSIPAFYNAGYSGQVDEVRFTSGELVVFDDITYNATTIPEPASWALMIAGFGLVGAAVRRRAVIAIA